MNKAIFLCALFVVFLAYTQASKPANPQRPDCLKLKCDNKTTRKLLCVRSKKGNCQLLTSCQVSRVNCQRGPQNVLNKVDPRQCAGMKPGQGLRKCKTVHKKSG